MKKILKGSQMKGGYEKETKKAAAIFRTKKIHKKRREKLERSKKRQLSRLCFLTTAKETNSNIENFKVG